MQHGYCTSMWSLIYPAPCGPHACQGAFQTPPLTHGWGICVLLPIHGKNEASERIREAQQNRVLVNGLVLTA